MARGSVIAALDLGSNTFRLALAEKHDGSPSEWRVYQHIPRISENLQPGGSFAPVALKRAHEALCDFAEKIKEAGAQKVLAGATMAARLAADGPQFIADIHKQYGWEAVILTGEEEARLTATGVLFGLSPLCPPQSLIFDIGGRSTEFIQAQGTELMRSSSLELGVAALTEAYLSDPVRPGELEKVSNCVRTILAKATPLVSTYLNFSDSNDAVVVGTAGTVTTVAALVLGLHTYQPELINGLRLTRPSLENLLHELAAETVAERVSSRGLHPRRADIVVAGLVVVLEIMSHLGRDEILVSDSGLLEGLWLWGGGCLDGGLGS